MEIYDLDTAADSRLANLSTRAAVNTNDNVVIAGFILGAAQGDTQIVVRGLGPSLSQSGVSNALQDPFLQLRDANGGLVTENNNWADDPVQAAELTAAQLAPEDPRESAIAASLPPGLYTATLSGVGETSGIGLVEVYDRR